MYKIKSLVATAKDINKVLNLDNGIDLDGTEDEIREEIRDICNDPDLFEEDDEFEELTEKVIMEVTGKTIEQIKSGEEASEPEPEEKKESPAKKEKNTKKTAQKKEETPAQHPDIGMIGIDKIKPDKNQPRQTFNADSIKSLSDSIKKVGIIEPIVIDSDFTIISGERRYQAAKLAKLKEVPCIIKKTDDKFMAQLIVNLQRENIDPVDEAKSIKKLIDNGYKVGEIAKLLNKSKSYVSQVSGIDRLSDKAKQTAKKTKAPKEVQIQASKEKDPKKQEKIIKDAATKKKTTKQVRKETSPVSSKTSSWEWSPKDESFTIIVKFKDKYAKSTATKKGKEAIKVAYDSLKK